MKTVFEAHSQNGRWGVEVVCTNDDWHSSEEELPRGTIKSLGRLGGTAIYQFSPDATVQCWILWNSGTMEYSAVSGAEQVCVMDLQGGRSASIVVLGQIAVIKATGYKGRSEYYYLYKEGCRQTLSEGQLVALGLCKPQYEPEDLNPIKPQEITGVMAEALKKAGLA